MYDYETYLESKTGHDQVEIREHSEPRAEFLWESQPTLDQHVEKPNV